MLTRIELLCCETPPDDAEAQQRTEETLKMYMEVSEALRPLNIEVSVTAHDDRGTNYVDAYVYPPIEELITVLDLLDSIDASYDNIDLPPGAPEELAEQLRKRYPYGVFINTDEIIGGN